MEQTATEHAPRSDRDTVSEQATHGDLATAETIKRKHLHTKSNGDVPRLPGREAVPNSDTDTRALAQPRVADRMRTVRLHDDRTNATPRSQEARLRTGRPRTPQQRREAIVARNRPDPTRLRRTTSSRQCVATFAASRPAGSHWCRQRSKKGPVAPTTAISPVPTATTRGWVPKPASESTPVTEQGSGAPSNQLAGQDAPPSGALRYRGVWCRVLPPSSSRVPNRARCRRLPATRLSRT